VIATAGVRVALRNLVIVPFPGGGGTNGITMSAGDSLTIEDCLVANLAQSGIAVSTDANLQVTRTTIRGNGGDGLRLSGGASATVTRATISANGGSGVLVLGSTGGTTTTADVANTTLDANSRGVYALSQDATAVLKVSVRRSRAVRSTNDGIAATSEAGASVTLSASSNMLSNNATGLAVSGAGTGVWASGNTVSDNGVGWSNTAGLLESQATTRCATTAKTWSASSACFPTASSWRPTAPTPTRDRRASGARDHHGDCACGLRGQAVRRHLQRQLHRAGHPQRGQPRGKSLRRICALVGLAAQLQSRGGERPANRLPVRRRRDNADDRRVPQLHQRLGRDCIHVFDCDQSQQLDGIPAAQHHRDGRQRRQRSGRDIWLLPGQRRARWYPGRERIRGRQRLLLHQRPGSAADPCGRPVVHGRHLEQQGGRRQAGLSVDRDQLRGTSGDPGTPNPGGTAGDGGVGVVGGSGGNGQPGQNGANGTNGVSGSARYDLQL
jgi:hypothetical protein